MSGCPNENSIETKDNGQFFADLPVLDIHNFNDKYFWKDNNVRQRSYRIQDVRDFEKILDQKVPRFRFGNRRSHLLLPFRENITCKNQVQFDSYDSEFKKGWVKWCSFSPHLPKSVDLTPWSGTPLNQGVLGDCFAYAAVEIIQNAYGRKLKMTKQYKDSDIKQFINTITPSVTFVTNSFYFLRHQYKPLLYSFSQGGFCNIVLKSLSEMNGIPLAVMDQLPKIIQILSNLEEIFGEGYFSKFKEIYSCKDQLYYIGEYFDKFIEPPNPILPSVSTSVTNYYKNLTIYAILLERDQIFFPLNCSENNLDGFEQKRNIKGELLWFDENGQETIEKSKYGVPKSTGDEYIELYKQVLNKKVSFNFNLPVYSNFPVSRSDSVLYPPKPSDTLLGGHAVVVEGFDDDRQVFIMKNSWGIGYCVGGYFYMSYDFVRFMFTYEAIKIFSINYLNSNCACKIV